jgi:regulator of PEP synthase PpsR (kinase-PPPase family)
MKLYLRPQLEQRALELYGSFEKIEEVRQEREKQKEFKAEKQFERKIHKMRKEVNFDHKKFLHTKMFWVKSTFRD